MNEVEQAKETLRKAGYFVDVIWTLNDINYNCSDEVKQEILSHALQCENTLDNIWYAIREEAESRGLTKIV